MTGATVLIIEDNPLNVELASDLLQADGFTIRATNTAEEGLRIAREWLPNLVLMDISLPGMDGLCAARELRADPATAHLTIAGLTAHAMKGDAGLALGAGFNAYLTKPIDTRTFVATVNELITSHSKH